MVPDPWVPDPWAPDPCLDIVKPCDKQKTRYVDTAKLTQALSAKADDFCIASLKVMSTDCDLVGSVYASRLSGLTRPDVTSHFH